MLQLIFQSPLNNTLFERFSAGDEIVFLEAAVLHLLKRGQFNQQLTQLQQQYQLYVIADDLMMRGISCDEIITDIILINYEQLVKLTITHQLNQSWI
jgi:sulfur relay protein TusB/DsrH